MGTATGGLVTPGTGTQSVMFDDCINCAFEEGQLMIRPLPEPLVMVKPGVFVQFAPGRTVTVKVLVAELPHWW